jgi:hypothetical protein
MPAVARLALAVLLASTGPVLWGCATSPELERVRTPREGVTVAYVLERGNGFEGTLRLGNTRPVEGLSAPLGQTATCDVIMAVVGTSPTGTEIRATFTSIELDWDLPPSATYSSQELLELAQEQLRGMQVSFVVRPDGRVQALPAPPAEAPPELREVIETMLLGLESFFVSLPAEPLGRRDAWTTSLRHDTAEGLSQALEQTVSLEGVYEHRTEDLVLRRLAVEQSRREQRPGDDGPVTVEREVEAKLMFATTGFPAEVDRETRELDPVRGVVFRKVRANWTRTREIVPELVAPVTNDVQVIDDPCNPDYVGPRTCDPPAPVPSEPEAPVSEVGDEPETPASEAGTEPEAPEPEAPPSKAGDEPEASEPEAPPSKAPPSKASPRKPAAPRKPSP